MPTVHPLCAASHRRRSTSGVPNTRTRQRWCFGLVGDAEDAHPDEFSDKHRGTPEERRALAVFLLVFTVGAAVPIFGAVAWCLGLIR